ncbi:MAG: hypothetical protein NUW22_13970 [Acidobacteria bacterium]|nr:hypothetical protein [Acidobacteriota bacterium]
MAPRLRDACVASFVALFLAVLLTWPLAPRLGSSSRIDSGDGRHGVWNVAWVAHALTTDPASLFDANIFYPHRQTLAYSEANLVAGVVAIPVWLATKNPLASYNTVVLLAFAGAALAGYLLVRVLGGSRLGASIAGLTYGFSPYMFAHIPHIQLLMTFGPALSLAAMHHFLKAPSLRRGLALGGALAVTGLACAYYGIFAGLVVGLGLLWSLILDRRLKEPRFWLGIAAAVAAVVVLVAPFFVPYLSVRAAGFERSLDEARLHATVGRAYLASAVLVHQWMLPLIGQWREVLFPGFHAVGLAALATALAFRARATISRRVVWLYVAMAVLAFWTSLGPDAGLYTLQYYTVPAFSFLRAPARFGVLVTLSAGVLSGLAVTWLQHRRWTAGPWLAAALVTAAVAESYVGPLRLADMPRVVEAYQRLAIMPRAPVVEFPFYMGAADRHRHTEYMLMSTYHWQPLVNGYSDYFPVDFVEATPRLASFPSAEAWDVIWRRQVRWVVVHFDSYSAGERRRLRPQLRAMGDRVRLVVDDDNVSLYEVIWPRPSAALPLP